MAAVCFVLTERRQAAPMLPLGLFRARAFSAGTGVGALFNLCLYGALICVSLFLQEARHESALATGLLILPMSVAVAAGSLASGRLTARFGPRRPMIAGLTLAAAGAAVLATVGETTPLAVLVAGSVVLGLTSLAIPMLLASGCPPIAKPGAGNVGRQGLSHDIQGAAMNDYPAAIVATNHVAPVPRRIRAVLAGQTVFDTTRALYVWEWPHYPQYYIPADDVGSDLLVPEASMRHSPSRRATCTSCGSATSSGSTRPGWSRVPRGGPGRHVPVRVGSHGRLVRGGRAGVRPPAQPLRAGRRAPFDPAVRVELDGVVLAESASPVMVFETGLPTRYYLNRTEVDFAHLIPSDTVTACPTRARPAATGRCGSAARSIADLAWTYDFPTRQLLPITGLIAFYNEKVDTFLDGRLLDRPETHFS